MAPGGQQQTDGGGYRSRQRMGGIELPWDHDPDLIIDNKPSKQFPALARPAIAKPPRASELREADSYRELRKRIREGPFYTEPRDEQGADQPERRLKRNFDSFGGMPTYSQKYYRQARHVPRLNTRPYITKFFPAELRHLLGDKDGAAPSAKTKTKSLGFAQASFLARLENLDGSGEEEGEEHSDDEQQNEQEENEKQKNKKQKTTLPIGQDGPEDEVDLSDDDELQDELEEDNAFEEDEDDDDNDYNAEKYFEGGEEDFDAEDNYDAGGMDDVFF